MRLTLSTIFCVYRVGLARWETKTLLQIPYWIYGVGLREERDGITEKSEKRLREGEWGKGEKGEGISFASQFLKVGA